MSYCIYLRKSRADLEAEAHGEGETLIRHEKALLELAKRQKLNITQIHREIVSGETISSRPVMQLLLNEVEQGLWEGVLVMEVERLARGDTIDQGIVAQSFKYSNTKIITPSKTYDPNNEYDEEYFEFGLFMSRREYKTINRRLQRGRLASVKEGKFLGSKAPYGYEKIRLEKQKGFTLQPIPEQAEIVQLIFNMYTKEQQGVSLIVRKLNQLQIKPLKSSTWMPSTIQDMLRNPVYAGKIRWNWRPTSKKMVDGQVKKERKRADNEDWVLVDGLHKPIISFETWQEAQKLLANNPSPPVPSRYKVKNAISGIIVCSECGRKMVRRPYASGQPDTLMCPSTACSNKSTQLQYVEKNVLNALQDWLEQYKFALENKSNASKKKNNQLSLKQKAIKKLEDELAEYESQLNNLHDLLERGVYSSDVFITRSRLLSERMSTSKSNIETLRKEIEQDNLQEQSIKDMIPKIERVFDAYSSGADAAYKNTLLKEVIDKAVYTKSVNGRWHNRPDDFELILYPKIPK